MVIFIESSDVFLSVPGRKRKAESGQQRLKKTRISEIPLLAALCSA
jgi:hypothetical protein